MKVLLENKLEKLYYIRYAANKYNRIYVLKDNQEGNRIIMTKKYQLLDLFSGAGGLSNGFEQTEEFTVFGAIEINTAAQRTYIRNHNGVEDLILKATDSGISDITEINFKSLNLDSSRTIVIGGPPCQGFSNANRQKNYLISGNNQLIKEFARAIRDIRPVAFLMENVKSMNSPIHKFFVTRYSEGQANDFSSKNHLEEITNIGDNPLYKNDYIELLVSNSNKIKEIVQQFESLLDVPEPVITIPNLITRLRTIERKIKNNYKVTLSNAKEQIECIRILELLESYKSLEICESIIANAKQGIESLIDGTISSEMLRDKLLDFIEFNRFLTRCHELISENIDCGKINFTEGSSFSVKVTVYSYNVVEYLERLFKYYGYSIDSGVLDASHFGVPQKRHRFLMMGVLGENKNVKLPSSGEQKYYTVKDAIYDLESINPQKDIESYNDDIYYTINKSNELLDYYRDGIEEQKLFDHINTKSSKLIQKRFNKILESGGKNFHSLPDNMKETYRDASRTQNTVYLRLKYTEPAPTVVNVRKSMWQHPNKARALSIREAARLQSFQDKYKFEGRKDERYQQIGNAVPPKLAKAVALKMLEYLA
jgi:DNA (cytosine-5)-methyltransferase 1